MDGGGSWWLERRRDVCDLSMMSQEIMMTVCRESKDETEIRIQCGHPTPVVFFLISLYFV